MVLIISCNKDAFIYKVDLDGIVLIILKTSSGFLWARRIDLTRIPMVPWTLNPNCSATKRAEASSVKNVAAESFSKMAKASIYPSSRQKIWQSVFSRSSTGYLLRTFVMDNSDLSITAGRCFSISFQTVSDNTISWKSWSRSVELSSSRCIMGPASNTPRIPGLVMTV